MIIRPAQIQALSGAQAHRFVRETVQRLRAAEPVWAAGRSDGELCVQVEEFVQLAASCRIRNRDAVLAVADALARYSPPRPLDPGLVRILAQPNVPERVRAEQFYLSLASGRHLLREIVLHF